MQLLVSPTVGRTAKSATTDFAQKRTGEPAERLVSSDSSECQEVNVLTHHLKDGERRAGEVDQMSVTESATATGPGCQTYRCASACDTPGCAA